MTISQTGLRNRRRVTRYIPLGFTLIEVLISVVILGTAIVATMGAFNALLVSLRQSRDVMLADLLVHEKTAELQMAILSDGESAFSSHQRFLASDDFAGEVDCKSIQKSPDGSNTLAQVVVTVWHGGDVRQYSASTMMSASKKETAFP